MRQSSDRTYAKFPSRQSINKYVHALHPWISLLVRNAFRKELNTLSHFVIIGWLVNLMTLESPLMEE